MKEIFHELGHAIGLKHCEHRGCVMRFSDSLADTAPREKSCARIAVGAYRRNSQKGFALGWAIYFISGREVTSAGTPAREYLAEAIGH
jgi:hypothetical protein